MKPNCKVNKRSKRTYTCFLSILLILLFILLSCSLEPHWKFTFSNPPIDGEGKANLIMNISSGLGAKTLLPDIDMNPFSYDIAGNGPDGALFSETSEQTTVEFLSLDPGDWIVSVNAKNIEGTVISMGKDSITLNPGNTKTLNIFVSPIEGQGTLDITVFWIAGEVINPSIFAQLTPASGSPIDLSFTVGLDSATCVVDTIPTGYHTLVVELLDNGMLVMGAVEVVRIVDGQTTSGVFEFFDINQPGGDFAVNIIPELNDPIEVSMNGQLTLLLLGESMNVSASVPPETGNVVYVWYVNGESKQTGASYTVGSELTAGVYRLDVTAFSADGKRAGSTSHTFRIISDVISSLFWEAEDGEITSPFTVSNGHITQDIETDVASGGKAIYPFIIENSGDYVVKVLVDAANEASNSLFVNIDAEPIDPDMIWDIQITNGFEERVVRWRGINGSSTYSEYDPKIFTLTEGEHELVIRGREANAKVDRLWLEPYTAPITAQVTLEWDANTEADLAGYKLHYGNSSGNYTKVIDVGNEIVCTVQDLVPGETYYFSATAYNTQGFESDYSNEVVYTVPLI